MTNGYQLIIDLYFIMIMDVPSNTIPYKGKYVLPDPPIIHAVLEERLYKNKNVRSLYYTVKIYMFNCFRSLLINHVLYNIQKLWLQMYN